MGVIGVIKEFSKILFTERKSFVLM